MDVMTYFVDVFLLRCEVAAATAAAYQAAVTRFTEFTGEAVPLSALDEDVINRWVMARLSSGSSPKTVKNQRNAVLRVWRHALAQGFASSGPRPERLRKVKLKAVCPEGFTCAEVRSLIQACEKFRDVESQKYWRALIQTCFETGLRRGDLFRLAQDNITDGGLVTIVCEKTGQRHTSTLSRDTLELLQTLPEFPLRWPGSLSCFRDSYRRLKGWAGVEGVRGLCQPLRRTGASVCEKQRAGDGSRFLGHRTPGLFERHYRVAKICDTKPPLPRWE